jgi:hypothetical protein
MPIAETHQQLYVQYISPRDELIWPRVHTSTCWISTDGDTGLTTDCTAAAAVVGDFVMVTLQEDIQYFGFTPYRPVVLLP